MIVIGFIIGFSFALGLIQLSYVINVKHVKKGENLVSEGKGLLEQQRQIQADLLNIELELNGRELQQELINGNG